MATTPDTRSTSSPGESRNQHFSGGAKRAVHNGMNDHPEIGRFGNDMGGGDFRGYDAGAWEGTSMHDRLMGETDD